MVKPTILIGGGYDKGSEFDLYVKAFKDKVKLLVLIIEIEEITETEKRENNMDFTLITLFFLCLYS